MHFFHFFSRNFNMWCFLWKNRHYFHLTDVFWWYHNNPALNSCKVEVGLPDSRLSERSLVLSQWSPAADHLLTSSLFMSWGQKTSDRIELTKFLKFIINFLKFFWKLTASCRIRLEYHQCAMRRSLIHWVFFSSVLKWEWKWLIYFLSTCKFPRNIIG